MLPRSNIEIKSFQHILKSYMFVTCCTTKNGRKEGKKNCALALYLICCVCCGSRVMQDSVKRSHMLMKEERWEKGKEK